MPKYIVGYNLPGCIPDEPPFEHDNFEYARFEIAFFLENHIEALQNKDLIRKYENLLNDVRKHWKEEDVPLSVRIGAYNAWIEKSDNTSEEEF